MPNAYRQQSLFIDPRSVGQPLSREQRHRILWVGERLELHTRVKGRASGCLGMTGLQVLRILLTFVGKDGACFPSYSSIRDRSGFARATISKALKALSRVGILKVMRRVCRKQCQRVNGWSGQLELFVNTLQTSNAYSFSVDKVAIPEGHRSYWQPLVRSFIKRASTATTLVQPFDRRTKQGFSAD